MYFLLESCRLKTATLPVFHLPNSVLVSELQRDRERENLPVFSHLSECNSSERKKINLFC